MKPVMFWRKTSGIRRWMASSMKCAPFSDELLKRIAVVGQDPDRVALDLGEPADQRLAVALLELVELAAVHQPGDHLAHVVAEPADRPG